VSLIGFLLFLFFGLSASERSDKTICAQVEERCLQRAKELQPPLPVTGFVRRTEVSNRNRCATESEDEGLAF